MITTMAAFRHGVARGLALEIRARDVLGASLQTRERSFSARGRRSAGMRLAPEVASGGAETRVQGATGPKSRSGGAWRGDGELAGAGLCKVGGGKRATGAGDEHATASKTQTGAALSERAPIPDRKQLIKSDFPGRAARVARYSTGSIRVQR
jgi:hypothetical protein